MRSTEQKSIVGKASLGLAYDLGQCGGVHWRLVWCLPLCSVPTASFLVQLRCTRPQRSEVRLFFFLLLVGSCMWPAAAAARCCLLLFRACGPSPPPLAFDDVSVSPWGTRQFALFTRLSPTRTRTRGIWMGAVLSPLFPAVLRLAGGETCPKGIAS